MFLEQPASTRIAAPQRAVRTSLGEVCGYFQARNRGPPERIARESVPVKKRTAASSRTCRGRAPRNFLHCAEASPVQREIARVRPFRETEKIRRHAFFGCNASIVPEAARNARHFRDDEMHLMFADTSRRLAPRNSGGAVCSRIAPGALPPKGLEITPRPCAPLRDDERKHADNSRRHRRARNTPPPPHAHPTPRPMRRREKCLRRKTPRRNVRWKIRPVTHPPMQTDTCPGQIISGPPLPMTPRFRDLR